MKRIMVIAVLGPCRQGAHACSVCSDGTVSVRWYSRL